MKTQQRVIDQLKKDLSSKDDQIIIKTLVKIRDKGNEQMVDPLIELYKNTLNPVIKENVKSIFSELKNTQTIDFLLPYLLSEDNEVNELILHGLWSSGMDVADHIPAIVECACKGSFMVILEALTLIENLEGPFIEEDLFNASASLQEHIHENKEGKEKDLLQSMYGVIQEFENQIET